MLKYYNRVTGNAVSEDEATTGGILKSGYGIHVPMTMMDSQPKYRTVEDSLRAAYERGLEDGRRRTTTTIDPMGRKTVVIQTEEGDNDDQDERSHNKRQVKAGEDDNREKGNTMNQHA